MLERSYWLGEFMRHHGGEEPLGPPLGLCLLQGVFDRCLSVCVEKAGNCELALLFFTCKCDTDRGHRAGWGQWRQGEDVNRPRTWWCLSSAAQSCSCSSRSPSFVPSGLSGVWTPEKHTYRPNLKWHRSNFIRWLDGAKHMNSPRSYWA